MDHVEEDHGRGTRRACGMHGVRGRACRDARARSQYIGREFDSTLGYPGEGPVRAREDPPDTEQGRRSRRSRQQHPEYGPLHQLTAPGTVADYDVAFPPLAGAAGGAAGDDVASAASAAEAGDAMARDAMADDAADDGAAADGAAADGAAGTEAEADGSHHGRPTDWSTRRPCFGRSSRLHGVNCESPSRRGASEYCLCVCSSVKKTP